VNLRGTWKCSHWRATRSNYHGLRRFSEVSTVAVAGKRAMKVVTEDRSIEWDRSDYDPYAAHEKILRAYDARAMPGYAEDCVPSSMCGDSRHAEITQFDWFKAFVFWLAARAAFRAVRQIDIVMLTLVADAIASYTRKNQPQYDTLPSFLGTDYSQTFRELPTALAAAQQKLRASVSAIAERPFLGSVNKLRQFARGRVGHVVRALSESVHAVAGLDTVFEIRESSRVGPANPSRSRNKVSAVKFSRENSIPYNYKPWPAAAGRDRRMMDFILGGVGQRQHRRAKGGLDAGRRESLAARREIEAALRRIQRHAEHGIGVASTKCAPDPAYSGRGPGRLSVMSPELRISKDISTAHAGPCRIFPPFCRRSACGITALSRRRIDVQEQVRQRSDHDDDCALGMAAVENNCRSVTAPKPGIWIRWVAKMCRALL